jgi:hypothetical protein
VKLKFGDNWQGLAHKNALASFSAKHNEGKCALFSISDLYFVIFETNALPVNHLLLQ